MDPNYLQEIVRRLEALMAERQELIERLERLAPGVDEVAIRSLITRLTRKQEDALAELTKLLPPDDAGTPAPG